MNFLKLMRYIQFIVFLTISGCKEPPIVEKTYSIRVQNNTNGIIAFLVNYSYPDTLIPDQYDNLKGIKAMDYTPYDSKKKWDEVFYENNATKITFFFFSTDTITKYGWDYVRTNYKILKRNDYSLLDLENSEYIVTYP